MRQVEVALSNWLNVGKLSPQCTSHVVAIAQEKKADKSMAD
ncbi:hypothetical protein [Nostoc sp.]